MAIWVGAALPDALAGGTEGGWPVLGEFGAVGRTLERFEQVLTPHLADANEDYYAWSPYPMGLFLNGLHEAMRYLYERDAWTGLCTFLDVGCGIGTKMAVGRTWVGG